MATGVVFPAQLSALLEKSDLQAPIRAYADCVGGILKDNQMPFFPDYTDHGIEHINRVLESAVSLVPASAWSVLCDADAVVLIGGVLLHDFAMHVRRSGFRELVRAESRFHPLPWFLEDQEGHPADRPWHELWDDYVQEAKRFSDRTISQILGPEAVAQVWKFGGLPEFEGTWERNHYLIVGEFLRRHHARLAHEIAIFGFPGLPVSGEGSFTALNEPGHPMAHLADLIGLTARSHGMSLRVCNAYLDGSGLYQGTPTPMDSAALFPMALLRVADYLQIDRKRAPAILLNLREPQSPVSVQEWKKHLAVQRVVPAKDPRGRMITVSNQLSLPVYLQVRDLVAGLQAEIDHATAVLDEAYGARADIRLNELNLSVRRVYSNIHSAAFRKSLPYVPEPTGFSSDPRLLTLLVEPLYGAEPSIGVRELMQNAVDAVRELERWCENHGRAPSTIPKGVPDTDVLIEFVRQDDGKWILRVSDNGIGMTADTIENYFLRAGASYRHSTTWTKEFVGDDGKPTVLRSGRFGIGAFAVFLLGQRFKLSTRHVSADVGCTLEASADSQVIEIRYATEIPVGTKIEVGLSAHSVSKFRLNSETDVTGDVPDWYCWKWPHIVRRIVKESRAITIEQAYAAPLGKGPARKESGWFSIDAPGFEGVYWGFSRRLGAQGGTPGLLTCNGMLVAGYSDWKGFDTAHVEMPLHSMIAPHVAVMDSVGNLPLTLMRSELTRGFPCIRELTRDVCFSLIAHALLFGAESAGTVLGPFDGAGINHPQWRGFRAETIGGSCWYCTNSAIVLADPWTFTLLGSGRSYFIFGGVRRRWVYTPSVRVMEAIDTPVIRIDNPVYADKDAAVEEAVAATIEVISRDNIWTENADVAGCEFIVPSWCAPEEIGSTPLGKLGSVWSAGSIGHLENPIRWHDLVPFIGEPGEPCYFAKVELKPGVQECESALAVAWKECLGENPIPFDRVQRAALVELGRQHSDLRRHIEYWTKFGPNPPPPAGWVNEDR